MSLPVNDIVQKYKEGASFHELAEEYGTYANKIRRLLKKLGVTLRDKSEAQSFALQRNRKEHPTAGKVRTDEERLKISKTISKFWDNISDEEREKVVERAREQWDNMSVEKKQDMLKKATDANRKASKEGSSVEKYVLQVLQDAGYFVKFHEKNVLSTELELDLTIPALRTVIEIDGPSHFKPVWGEKSLQRQIDADTRKSGIILSKGLVLIRVKYLLSRFTLAAKDEIKTKLLTILEGIKKSFPPANKRFIEVQIGHE